MVKLIDRDGRTGAYVAQCLVLGREDFAQLDNSPLAIFDGYSDWVRTAAALSERYFDSAPPVPDAPDAFRFASPGKLQDILAEAGATAPSERLLQFTVHAPISVEDCWILRREMSDKLREKIATLSTEQFTEVQRQSIEALGEYSTDRGMSFPAEVLIVSGTKNRPT